MIISFSMLIFATIFMDINKKAQNILFCAFCKKPAEFYSAGLN